MSHKQNDILKKVINWTDNNPRNELNNQPKLPNKPNDDTQSNSNWQPDNKNTEDVINRHDNSNLLDSDIRTSEIEKKNVNLINDNFDQRF